MRHLTPIAVLVLGFWQAAALPAHAYVDPGTGSMLWQVLLSAALGLGYAVRSLFRRKGSEPPAPPDQE